MNRPDIWPQSRGTTNQRSGWTGRLTWRAAICDSSSMVVRTLLFALVICSLMLTPLTSAWAAAGKQDATIAAEAMREGLAAEKQGEWLKARDAFQRSADHDDLADTRLHLARAEARLGHLTEASDHYKAVLNKPASAPTRAAAKKELQTISERVPHITVNVPADFSGVVRIDRVELAKDNIGKAMDVNPGTREITADAEGCKPFRKSVVIADRANETVDVTLEKTDAKSPQPGADEAKLSTNDGSTRKTLTYVAFGVGGVGLILGTAFGLASRSTRADLDSGCPGNVCDESMRDTYEKGKTQTTIATVGFLTAAVGIGAGVVLLLTAPKKKAEPAPTAHFTPYVGPGSVGVTGSF